MTEQQEKTKWTLETLPEWGSERITFSQYYPSGNPDDWYGVPIHPEDFEPCEPEYQLYTDMAYAADAYLEMKIDGKGVHSLDWIVYQHEPPSNAERNTEPTERDVYDAFLKSIHPETET